jgi:hypothetical protein
MAPDPFSVPANSSPSTSTDHRAKRTFVLTWDEMLLVRELSYGAMKKIACADLEFIDEAVLEVREEVQGFLWRRIYNQESPRVTLDEVRRGWQPTNFIGKRFEKRLAHIGTHIKIERQREEAQAKLERIKLAVSKMEGDILGTIGKNVEESDMSRLDAITKLMEIESGESAAQEATLTHQAASDDHRALKRPRPC